jgi:hypothetical protein
MDPKEQQSSDGKQRKQSNRSPPYALFNLLVIVVAIIYAAYYQFYLNGSESLEKSAAVEADESDQFKIPMFTSEQLKAYNGEGECRLRPSNIIYVCTVFWFC